MTRSQIEFFRMLDEKIEKVSIENSKYKSIPRSSVIEQTVFLSGRLVIDDKVAP